ncbi:apoptosis facilitator Bcl-2-like protein 14 [Thunnus maccoyii]|uniref:apoptosis facilitator Bcl-2-like protein 14 n=1 Tax=Thunnus maccoyii TaxID=8240 RepID=UPI001C4C550E|nr:apoptosis facilitator Bcl-2-like protein 14 [Thunnus maccoyii]
MDTLEMKPYVYLLKMAWRLAAGGMEKSDVMLLLEEYCSRRSQQRSQQRSQRRLRAGLVLSSGAYHTHIETDHESGETEFRSGRTEPTFQPQRLVLQSDEFPDTTRTTVADRLVQIADSAPIPEVDVEDHDEIIQKMVELMKTFGDDINKKIKQNMALQQQLRTMNYDMFERLTSSMQNLVGQEGQGAAAAVEAAAVEAEAEAASDRRIQQQKIAWAFEVTSRLSAMDLVPKRRVLSFADRYIQQHHNAWLQQHGGWEEVFDVENVD